MKVLCALPGAKGARREHRFNPLFLPRLDKLQFILEITAMLF
jgi:hypothetical protein